MAKKKKKKKKYESSTFDFSSCSNKDLKKKFNKALQEIEDSRMAIYEADKKARKKERKKINKKQYDFYTSMDGIKARRKISKKWEKEGFLDSLLGIFQNAAPFIKILAKAVSCLIVLFLSIDCIKTSISPSFLRKLANVFDVASSM